MQPENHRLSELVRQDLFHISNSLPYTGQDHYKNLVYYFKKGGHQAKNEYIDGVFLFIRQAHSVNKPLIERLYEKWGEWMDLILSNAVEAKKWLNR